MAPGSGTSGAADIVGVKELVKLDNFKGKFSAREFVEAITAKLIIVGNNNTGNIGNKHAIAPSTSLVLGSSSGETGRYFDPKPLIRVFDAASDELLRLKKRIQSKIDDLEDQAAASETGRRRKMKEFADSFDDVQRAFESLDSRLSEVGNTTIRIGEQLETIDKQKTRAAEAKDLIQQFLEFNKGVFTRLDTLRRSGPEGEYKARTNIEKYCEGLEKSLLAEFDQAYSQADRETMSQIARTLLDFNGGNSCVQTYVNQHAFFINLLKIAETEQEGNGYDQVSPTKADQGLLRLYEEIRIAIFNEWDVICAVFPNSASVMQVFVQRIFAQSIQNFLERLLERARSDSLLLYLQTLALSHAATAHLVADIHRFDEKTIASMLGAPVLSGLVNRCFDDLFVPYLDNSRYIELEQQWLLETLQACLAGAGEQGQNTTPNPYYQRNSQQHGPPSIRHRAHSQHSLHRKSPSRSSISPIKETSALPLSSAAVVSSFMSTVATTMNTLGQQLTGLQHSLAASPVVAETAWVPAFEDTLSCFRAYSQSIKRCKELCKLSDLSNYASILFRLLVEEVGIKFVQNFVDSELEELSLADFKAEPDFGHLHAVKTATHVLQVFQLQFQSQLLPLLTSSPTLHREMVLFKNDFFSSTEQRANGVLQRKISVIVAWLETLLSRQKKTDYKPRDDIVAVNTLSTQVCNQTVDFVRRVKDEAEESLSGENLETYLTEIGVSLHSLLVDHYKKFHVSYAGGLVLTKDLSRYHEVIMTFKIDLLQERFDMLKELGNLFIVKPENLKSVINEGYLGRIEANLLHPYLSLRADWSKLAKLEKELFEMEDVTASSISLLG
ncbi:exocyst complex component Sec10-domain-containing protein [Entophlyctis helioformis]|nr:exocyst complex component Sec10-domain-containing protein [Entophlyctis helioformis]